jgi:NAD(P)-dependent dehydrogenase (short-subunit alcohol dehydrogenase family)
MDLNDRVILLTGVKRIGVTVARELARRGAHVAVGYDRSRAEAEALIDQVQALSRRATAIHGDLSTFAACAALVQSTIDQLGRLDGLVAMASRYVRTPLDDLTDAHWDAALAVDLKAVAGCSHAARPHMRAAGGGRIITFSDWVAQSGRPRYKGYLGYYVAKAGVVALTEALALELARDNILVNCIAPGPILAPDRTTAAQRGAVSERTPLGRWGGPDEIAKVVIALLESDFITGETVRVDGGRHLR